MSLSASVEQHMPRFLPGILFIQLITLALFLVGVRWADDIQLLIVIIVFGLIVAVLAAFWFAAIARDLHKEVEMELHKQHSRERENIRTQAEQEKTRVISESYRQIEKATRQAHRKANFKVAAACTVAMAAGGLMIFSQLVTVGMMVLVASGSGLAGYLTRARQERLSRNRQLLEIKTSNLSVDAPDSETVKKLQQRD